MYFLRGHTRIPPSSPSQKCFCWFSLHHHALSDTLLPVFLLTHTKHFYFLKKLYLTKQRFSLHHHYPLTKALAYFFADHTPIIFTFWRNIYFTIRLIVTTSNNLVGICESWLASMLVKILYVWLDSFTVFYFQTALGFPYGESA